MRRVTRTHAATPPRPTLPRSSRALSLALLLALLGVTQALACRSSTSREDANAHSTSATPPALLASASPTVTPAPLDDVEAITGGLDHACALRAKAVYCWDQPLETQGVPQTVARATSGLAAIRAIAAGGRRTCALDDGGVLACWGELLGNNDGTVPGQVHVPTRGGANPLAIRWGPLTRLDFGRPIAKVAVGMTHICALTGRHDLYCWGASSSGQLRHDTPMEKPELTAESVDDVEVGHGFTCYVVAGKRQCIGAATWIPNLAQRQFVQMPGWHLAACGVTAEGRVMCQGASPIVHPGGPAPGDAGDAPVTIAGVDNVRQLAVGLYFACAARSDGVVLCWGAGAPAEVALPARAKQLVASAHDACALLETGRVACWGAGRALGAPTHAPPTEIRFDHAPATGTPVPAIALREPIERYRAHDAPTPAELAGTTWHARFNGSDECRYVLRFGANASFVADGTCPSRGASTSWKGTWSRAKDHVTVREQPAPAGTRWEWQLDLHGVEIVGVRQIVPSATDASDYRTKPIRSTVQGGLDAPSPPVTR